MNMTHFEQVTDKWGSLPYMDGGRASYLRDLMLEHGLYRVIEIGFFQGKSSAYIAAMMEDAGRGHLTTIDKANARSRTPNIDAVLLDMGLTHRVSVIYADRSYTWELGKMLQQNPRPQFDLCYFDGGHTWDATGFGFVLVDMLLRPGGWIVFDDLDWTIAESLAQNPQGAQYKAYSDDERQTPGVRMVWNIIAPHLGYQNMREEPRYGWGIAQKPL